MHCTINDIMSGVSSYKALLWNKRCTLVKSTYVCSLYWRGIVCPKTIVFRQVLPIQHFHIWPTMSISCLFIYLALWHNDNRYCKMMTPALLLSTFQVPLLIHLFPHMLCLPHFGPGPYEGCATLLCIRWKEARIAQETVSIFQLLKFFPSLCPILCAWLILPLWSGFGLVGPLWNIFIVHWCNQDSSSQRNSGLPNQNLHLHQFSKLTLFMFYLSLLSSFFQLVFCFRWLSTLFNCNISILDSICVKCVLIALSYRQGVGLWLLTSLEVFVLFGVSKLDSSVRLRSDSFIPETIFFELGISV